jgi:hypothetical protein
VANDGTEKNAFGCDEPYPDDPEDQPEDMVDVPPKVETFLGSKSCSTTRDDPPAPFNGQRGKHVACHA